MGYSTENRGNCVEKFFIWSSILAISLLPEFRRTKLRAHRAEVGVRVWFWAYQITTRLKILDKHAAATRHSPDPTLNPYHFYNTCEKAAQ